MTEEDAVQEAEKNIHEKYLSQFYPKHGLIGWVVHWSRFLPVPLMFAFLLAVATIVGAVWIAISHGDRWIAAMFCIPNTFLMFWMVRHWKLENKTEM